MFLSQVKKEKIWMDFLFDLGDSSNLNNKEIRNELQIFWFPNI